ncbi:aminotransferase class I/II-fold pyridoxal phosphate-dependent enzyme [Ktedonosporobacter rubrisoli]|uniref:Aminotransferase class I/II-fold pyridoxal phosphate-dependent enzyme n=1 Tax=Ktedonosporobacter rubrisoli TaxID=2509675 RepID=A0A4P6JQZ2_KTERU|nr:aminotransferase class I/II-fold pyridoxal phosphate-dependent enzyme [Ktedonosporobacter rubrisoli]QBD77196.1 aminotransferase class I/II-fold pyridoxal phosphate-dependent enzyme [Ktedonosporobacter rubrisoli]
MLSSSVTDEWKFTEFVLAAQQESFLYDIPVVQGPAYTTVSIEQKAYVNFAGINFLGLQQDPQVLEYFTRAAYTYGLVTGGSRMTQGVSQAHRELEEMICRLTGKERTITFASGLLANLGFVHAMSSQCYMNPHCSIDNRDAIFVLDHDCHWSLWKAVERFPFGKQLFSFRHNTPAHLRELLIPLAGKKVIVIFESVYSSDGSIAPIGEILDICEEYGAISYVDDANGFLIYGPEQRPFAHEFAHLPRATFIMMSFAKSVGLEGGAIAGPHDAILAFELLSGTSLFTAAMQPPTASTAHMIIQKLQTHPHLVDTYLERAALFRQRLTEIGCTLYSSPSYITSIFVGSDSKVKCIRRAFHEQNYIIPVFHYPAVKQNQAIVRIILHAHHTEEQINAFLELLAELKKLYAF